MSFISVEDTPVVLLFPRRLAPLYPAHPAPGGGAVPAAPVLSVPGNPELTIFLRQLQAMTISFVAPYGSWHQVNRPASGRARQ